MSIRICPFGSFRHRMPAGQGFFKGKVESTCGAKTSGATFVIDEGAGLAYNRRPMEHRLDCFWRKQP